MDFVEICNVCARKAIIKAATWIINSDKMCRSYSDMNFGVTFLEHSVYSHEKELSNKNVFNCLLNTVNEGAEVTLVGRLFHGRATVTGNERSTAVRSHVRGIISRWQEPL